MADNQEDLTGRGQLGWNVTVVWLGQIVVFVSGFIVPRLIDARLSQESLGVWDFGWSTVSYFRFLGLGMAGGLNRYVAYYRAQNDREQMMRAVSSTTVLQLGVAVLVLLVSFLVGHAARFIFDDGSAELAYEARWLIMLLGAGIAVRMVYWPARGILGGYHLWSDNAITSAWGDIALLAVMIVGLQLGGGLTMLGLSFLATTIFSEVLRGYYAKRAYKGAFLVWQSVDVAMMRKMLTFGMKTSIVSLPQMLVGMAITFVIASTTGAATFAVFARPSALVRHVYTIVSRFTMMLSSTAGSLHGLGQELEIRIAFLTGTRAAFAIALPLLLIVGLYGDVIVEMWMGEGYVNLWLAPALAAGALLPYTNAAGMEVLIGLNSHGRVALLSLAACVFVLLIGMAAGFVWGWSLELAAIMFGASLTAGPGLVVPWGACRRLGVGFFEYSRTAFAFPLICNVPFAAIAILPRLHSAEPPLIECAIAVAVAGIVLAALYWFYLLEPDTKSNFLRRLQAGRRSPGRAR